MTPYATYNVTPGDNISLITGLIILLVFLGLCAGLIILQVYLSKRESMWPGLIMPIITFGFSLLILFSMAVFMTTPGESGAVRVDTVQIGDVPIDERNMPELERIAESEAIITDRYTGHLVAYGTIGRTQIVSFPRIAFILVIFNIPTIIFLAIYAGCRGKRRKQRSLELMSVQDLE